MTFDNITILSWNIQSSVSATGRKFDDTDFTTLLNQYSILCLQETRQAIKHPGYRSLNKTRKEEKNGGVCTLVRNNISKGITLQQCSIPDVIICKASKSFFKLPEDIFLINSYIRPANSSSKTIEFSGLDQLKDLTELINNLSNKGKIILCGDFNSRIGTDNDFILDISDAGDTYIPVPEDILLHKSSPRNTEDQKENGYKRPFLDMVINNGLTLVNGRTTGDMLGKYTCIRPSGSSVVDYFICSADLYYNILHMVVQPFTIYSDHKPIVLTLDIHESKLDHIKELSEKYEAAPPRYKLQCSSEATFKEELSKDHHTDILRKISEKNYSNNNEGTYEMNNDFTNYLESIANNCLEISKTTNKRKFINKQPWFSRETREAKKALNKAARLASEYPSSDYLRHNYYKVKKTYNSLCTRRKDNHFADLNKQIEQGNIINWKQFKKLKQFKTKTQKFDSLDMNNFEDFFSSLYSNEHTTISAEKKETLVNEAKSINSQDNTSTDKLNKIITPSEITISIKSLKKGKSSSDDKICNEFLKYLDNDSVSTLCKLYNKCLDTGTYPWNNNIITPLHKKGCKSNPDNYRAVAVSSTIGKLFSTILLNRILEFKSQNKADPINQLGFTKGAQTNDHILTLSTIASKYKKKNVPVYAVFVDFRKAFDSVCREALFYKIAKLGIQGKIFNTLYHMYNNSTGQIKLEGHISNKFPIRKGTEQGHPLSPDLFKIYIRDLSDGLDSPNCPRLMDQIISHLLWADDLILLALDTKTLQHQLDHLHKFCQDWGVEINVSKTKLLIFHRHLLSHQPTGLKIGGIKLEHVDSYCYLGIEIHHKGTFSAARSQLKKKAMRSLYGLKGTVNKSRLSFRSLTTLFDSLIKPIALYGAPIWTPTMSVLKDLAGLRLDSNNEIKLSSLKRLSALNCEKVHLHFLKWALGVNRKTSNTAVWGESGRYPLIIECLNLTLNYVKRLQNMKDNSLVALAFKEQKALKLDWYKGIEPILNIDQRFSSDHITSYKIRTNKFIGPSNNLGPKKEHFIIHKGIVKKLPTQSIKPIISQHFTVHIITKDLKKRFRKMWLTDIRQSRKLEYYSMYKTQFLKEPYLDSVRRYHDRASTTRLRTSAHRLAIETGRYSKIPREHRYCSWCNLSMGELLCESESHFLDHCDLNAKNRSLFLDNIKHLTCHFSITPETYHKNISSLLSFDWLGTEEWSADESPEDVAREIHRKTSHFIGKCFNQRTKFQDNLSNNNGEQAVNNSLSDQTPKAPTSRLLKLANK